MSYTDIDFKTKKAIKDAIAAGKKVTCYNPGLGTCPTDGKITLEGPHYPKPHSWYASGVMKDGYLISIK